MSNVIELNLDKIARSMNIKTMIKIGEGTSMVWFACISDYMGEKRLLLLQLNRYTAYVTGKFSIPFSLVKNVIDAIKDIVLIDGGKPCKDTEA